MRPWFHTGRENAVRFLIRAEWHAAGSQDQDDFPVRQAAGMLFLHPDKGQQAPESPLFASPCFHALKAVRLTGLREMRDHEPETAESHHGRGGFIGVIR